MGWSNSVKFRIEKRTAILGGAAVALAAGAVLVTLGATRSGATARQASLTVNLPPAFTDKIYGAQQARGRPIVVIDAGHGGRDPGARSVSGEIFEKDLTLAFAHELRDQLVQRGRVRVALTRDDDRYLTLDDRAAVARRLGAEAFISIHIDSAANSLARGASVYSLSDVASDAAAAQLAAKENLGTSATQRDGSVQGILSDLAMRSQMSASADLASRLVHKAAGRFELRPQPHKFAGFYVLRSAHAPAVLFEAGYISNVDDEDLLRNPQHRSAIVLALAQTIETDIAARSRH
jgi:N-acetylmuramoyl-L-alanine amidase